jgi:hypothetical protein
LPGRWWLMPVIPATQEAEIRRMEVWSQSEQIVHETLSWKTLHKNRAGGVAQGAGPEFKPQYQKEKKKKSLFFRENKKSHFKKKNLMCVHTCTHLRYYHKRSRL